MEKFKIGNGFIDNMKHSTQLRNSEIWLENYDMDDIYTYNYYIGRIKDMQKKYNRKKIITFKIHSYGGSVHGELSLISTIEKLKEEGWIVRTVGMGTVMSAAFDILISGSKGYRYCQRYSELMTHDSRNFQYKLSTHADKERDYKLSEKSMEVFINILEKNTHITEKHFMEYVDRKEDWFMNVSEAKSLFVIDHII